MLKGTSIYLRAYIQDLAGNPKTGLTLADVTFYINYTDNTAPASATATYELDKGWYVYLFTDALGKNFVYTAEHASYQQFDGAFVEVVDTEEVSGTHNHADSTAEQDVITQAITTTLYKFRSIMLDMTTITQNTTIRVKAKIDGSTYRTIDELEWDASIIPGIVMGDFSSANDVKLTMQSAVGEGSIKNVPYSLILEAIT